MELPIPGGMGGYVLSLAAIFASGVLKLGAHMRSRCCAGCSHYLVITPEDSGVEGGKPPKSRNPPAPARKDASSKKPYLIVRSHRYREGIQGYRSSIVVGDSGAGDGDQTVEREDDCG